MGLFSGVKKAISGASKFISSNQGLFDLGSSLISGGMAYLGQNSANAANAEEAAKNRAWQEQMRATQYQTAVKDMILAGLNPMLAYQQGGAGNLSGAVSAPQQNALGQFASSALQAKQLFGQLDHLQKQNDNLDKQNEKLLQDVSESQDRASLMKQQTKTEAVRAKREAQQMILDRAQTMSNIRMQASQARNYDANTALSAIRNKNEQEDYFVKRIDNSARSRIPGRASRELGTMVGDLGQILNFFRGSK